MKKNTLTLLGFLLCLNSFGQNVILDKSFNQTGLATVSFSAGRDRAHSLALQKDGKVVIAGYTSGTGDDDFAICRYNVDGSLDISFNSDGKATTSLGAGDDVANVVKIQSDSKILVAGSTMGTLNLDFAMVRYNTDGTLDNTFGNKGKVRHNIEGKKCAIRDMLLQSNGKILATGYMGNFALENSVIARYLPNGNPDSSFGTNGYIEIPRGSGRSFSESMALQSDGSIIIGGYSIFSNDYSFTLTRVNSDGVLDTTFGTKGIVAYSFGNDSDEIFAIDVQPDDKILAAGRIQTNGTVTYGLARFTKNGDLDNTFGPTNQGINIANVDPNEFEDCNSMALLSDGKILLAGNVDFTDPNNSRVGLAMFNSNGTLDTTFDTDGMYTENQLKWSNDVIVTTDGKIIVAGFDGNSMAVARIISGAAVSAKPIAQQPEVIIFPVPSKNVLHLNYSLEQAQYITQELVDVSGRVVHTFQRHILQNRGRQVQQLALPIKLSSGTYFISLSSSSGWRTLHKIYKK